MTKLRRYLAFAAVLFVVILCASAFSAQEVGGESVVSGSQADNIITYAVVSDKTDTDTLSNDETLVSAADAALAVSLEDVISDTDRQANLDASLQIMGQGMLGIFIVMFLIYIVIVILNALSNKKPKKDEN